jgi:hypothetical protein
MLQRRSANPTPLARSSDTPRVLLAALEHHEKSCTGGALRHQPNDVAGRDVRGDVRAVGREEGGSTCTPCTLRRRPG